MNFTHLRISLFLALGLNLCACAPVAIGDLKNTENQSASSASPNSTGTGSTQTGTAYDPNAMPATADSVLRLKFDCSNPQGLVKKGLKYLKSVRLTLVHFEVTPDSSASLSKTYDPYYQGFQMRGSFIYSRFTSYASLAEMINSQAGKPIVGELRIACILDSEKLRDEMVATKAINFASVLKWCSTNNIGFDESLPYYFHISEYPTDIPSSLVPEVSLMNTGGREGNPQIQKVAPQVINYDTGNDLRTSSSSNYVRTIDRISTINVVNTYNYLGPRIGYSTDYIRDPICD